ncbi:MAG: glycosyltransferase family 4 protein, partial [Planctomycetota bacterium]
MRVFMLGWEFPPFISGGLGTACYGLTKAMDQLGVEVTFVLPAALEGQYTSHVKLLAAGSHALTSPLKLESMKNVTFRAIDSPLQPYSTPDVYQRQIEETLRQNQKDSGWAGNPFGKADYSGDMYREVYRYAAIAAQLAAEEQFDIVHAHDWITYPAGILVSQMSGKPLIVHVHSTEFDRSGEHVNQMIYDIERQGMHAAHRIITVSHFTRNILISRYGVPGEKVEVVHNGVQRNGGEWTLNETG